MTTTSPLRQNRWLVGLVLAAAVFLAGFLPQYLETRRLRNELRANDERIEALELDARMTELRDLAGLMLVEALRQNYGLARNHSTEYFERLQALTSSLPDSPRKTGLSGLLGLRDAITAALAQSDPRSTLEIQALYLRTQETTLGR